MWRPQARLMDFGFDGYTCLQRVKMAVEISNSNFNKKL